MTRGLVTFQVLEGIDKGRIFRDLPTPVTLGREEGNLLRLNDERVSRFHAKVQVDNEDYILTDLESTNGTRVNGLTVQIRRLRMGDRISLGRSTLIFGSSDDIAARLDSCSQQPLSEMVGKVSDDNRTVQANTVSGEIDANCDFELNDADKIRSTRNALFIGSHALPPLPMKLNPSQAARLAEILDFLHKGITDATEYIQANEEGTEVLLQLGDWQRILAVQMLLARYLRLIGEPPETIQE